MRREHSNPMSTARRVITPGAKIIFLETEIDKKNADIKHLREQCESIRKLHEGLPDRYDELDGKYADALDEIERLRNEIVVLQRNELYMKELATRAADMLAESKMYHLEVSNLIGDLRDAAK
jgi:chromosome segregation ATPase